MKNIFLTTIALLVLSLSAQAQNSNPVLICKSTKKVEGWTGSSTFDYLRYTAYVKDNQTLEKAVIKGAFLTDTRDLTADQDLENKFSRNRFSLLEDAWCWFNLLTPKNLTEQTGSFKSTVQYICEEQHSYTYVDLSCFIKK